MKAAEQGKHVFNGILAIRRGSRARVGISCGGASELVVVDVSQEKLDIALKYGATKPFSRRFGCPFICYIK